MINTKLTSNQIENYNSLASPVCRDLNTLANYAVEVTTQTGHFAHKIYNPASRDASEVQWEIDLTLHLLKNGAPVAKHKHCSFQKHQKIVVWKEGFTKK